MPPLEVGVGEAAREALPETREPFGLHPVALRIGQSLVEGLAVDRGGHGHVTGVLHASLDLERGHAGRQQRRQGFDGREVGGREHALERAHLSDDARVIAGDALLAGH